MILIRALLFRFWKTRTGSPRIELLKGLGPSDSGHSTFAEKINPKGDIAGTFEFSDELTQQGFVRHRDGTLVTIMHPDELRPRTSVNEINDSGLIAGNYFGNSGEVDFFLSGDTYTDFVVPGASNTYIYSLNNAGDFTGSADFQSPPNYYQPYVNIGGVVTLLSRLGSFTAAEDINNLNQVVGIILLKKENVATCASWTAR